MPGFFGTSDIRSIRASDRKDESSIYPSSTDVGVSLLDIEVGGNENTYHDGGGSGVVTPASYSAIFLNDSDPDDVLLQPLFPQGATCARRKRTPFLARWLGFGRRASLSLLEKPLYSRRRPRSLRVIVKSCALALMLLGFIEFLILLSGLVTVFLPDTYDPFRPKPSSNWPTDYTADIQPYQCHSHNDYWRRVPLKSAIKAGCTGVEADVWLYRDQPRDLYVGHTPASLTSQRTFKNLYIDPLVEILEHQNPNTSFHPNLDTPRNGVFDVDPTQTLVLLVDFKTEGQALWPVVSQQLEPLRERQYLTHFNGTAVVNGPITIVVTGNAPFNKVVQNPRYRDMFFDAPLDLMGSLSDGSDEIHSASTIEGLDTWTTFDDLEERVYLDTLDSLEPDTEVAKTSNQGQGHSGLAPKNAAIYTPANSYYASVKFGKAIGYLFPYPYLTEKQKTRIRQQIDGAHKQGLKVRYWSTPVWPIGLREYVWRSLIEAGIDYLNVDDLRAATKGHWADPQARRNRWGLDWSPWDRS